MRSYSSGDLSRQSGAPVPLIVRYVESGIIGTLGGGGAKGRHYRFLFSHAFENRAAWALWRLGLPRATVKLVVRYLSEASAPFGWEGLKLLGSYSDHQLADVMAWREMLTDVALRARGAVLVYRPGALPEIRVGDAAGRIDLTDLSARSGDSAVLLPILALLRSLEGETGDRWVDVPTSATAAPPAALVGA